MLIIYSNESNGFFFDKKKFYLIYSIFLINSTTGCIYILKMDYDTIVLPAIQYYAALH